MLKTIVIDLFLLYNIEVVKQTAMIQEVAGLPGNS